MASRTTARGAHALGDDDRRKSGGWWKWLLALLLLAALAILLIALLTGGDDSPESATKSAVTSAVQPGSSTATPAAGGSAVAGSLTAGGSDLLPVTGADISAQVGQSATGTGIEVQSVVDGGFFVGTSARDRRYVEYGGDVGADEPAQSYKPAVGDKVDLTGPVTKAPKSAGTTLKLNEADAALVSTQGAYINADIVKAAS